MNVKKISFLVSFLLIIGVFIIYELFKYNNNLTNSFKKSEEILNNLDSLKKEEYKLNYLILKTTFYLYENNDKVVNEIKKVNNIINNLENNTFFKNHYPLTYKKFLNYAKIYNNKKNNIYRFFIYNSLIKNATIYLDKLLIASTTTFDNNKKFLQKEIFTIGNVLITKSSFDESFLGNLDIKYFKNIHFKNEKKEMMKNILLQNLLLFKNSFVKYNYYFNKIQNSKSLNYLNRLYKNYYYERNKNIKTLNKIFYFIIVILLGGIFLISFLLYLINKEQLKLKKAFVTDFLTSLGNREKFNIDIKNYKNPTFYLINIDKFKHINDIYGSKIGDEILKKVGEILRDNFSCNNKNVYRLGADDFAIICEGGVDYKKIENIINYFKNNVIDIDGRKFNINVSIGISKEFPLIETADMAIKKVKKDSKLNYLMYDKNSNLKSSYEENFNKSKILQDAIKNDLIIPVFQPIFNNKTLKICKYEVLARIKTKKGLVSIFPYLKIAKEDKVYKEITKSIYLKAYEVFKNNNCEFSLNLSIDDLLEDETKNLIDTLFKDRDFAKRCTFEILESESINDYDMVKNFINKMKKLGVKFAIDDFGSGYSNFEHILNLEIDYIKIDGSLIKKIENKNTQIIVETINSFAKKMNIKTIAEFVATKEIFEKVKELEIDCTQGFYLSEPLEKI